GDPDHDDAAFSGKRIDVAAQVRRADQLQDHVEWTVLLEAVRLDHSRAELRTVAVTRAPTAAPSWIAAVPTPPAPPCTSSRSPGCKPTCGKSASWAVAKTSGKPPACGQSSAEGTGISIRSCTTASSACPPPPTIAITRSPASKRAAPGPFSTTSPAISSPGMSGGQPGGAG